jgi:glucan 1,3-beta-glucosidase
MRSRFEAVHLRRLKQDPFEQRDWTATQKSTLKGYDDGFNTGKTFAVNGNFSKVGFVEQYIADTMPKLGPSVVAPGTEDNYRMAFRQGLRDIEATVAYMLHS